jgi:hypothetical protein
VGCGPRAGGVLEKLGVTKREVEGVSWQLLISYVLLSMGATQGMPYILFVSLIELGHLRVITKS